MTTTAERIQEIEDNAAMSGIELPAGASEADIAALEQSLGVGLPDEVRAFYRAHDGGGEGFHCQGHKLFSLQEIFDNWDELLGQLEAGDFDSDEEEEEEDADDVRQAIWLRQWIPLTTDGDDNWIMLDYAPGKAGVVGQLIGVWENGLRTVENASFLSWLSQVGWYDAEMAPGAGEDDEDEESFDADSDEDAGWEEDEG